MHALRDTHHTQTLAIIITEPKNQTMKNFIKLIALTGVIAILSFTSKKKTVLVIDVGHGGQDIGALVHDVEEKDVILDIAQRIKSLNQDKNIEIVLSRNTDEFLSLAERTDLINKMNPDYVISLHANESPNTTTSGIRIYLNDKGKRIDQSGNLAMELFKNLNSPKKQINKGNFYVLNYVKAPAILVELGFLSNPEDFQQLTSDQGKDELATSILNSIK